MRLARIIQRALRRTLGGNLRNSAVVILRYDDSAVPLDPNDEASYGSGSEQSRETKALVHFISEGEVVSKGLLELKASDAVLDFAPDEDLDGKSNLRFEIDGRLYAQKRVGKETMEYIDLLVGGERMFRTVVAGLIQKP